MNNPIEIKLLDSHLSPAKKIEQMTAVGTPMSTDADPDIAAQGTALLNEAGTLQTALTAQDQAQQTAKSKTLALHTEEATSSDVYKASMLLLQKKFPNNQTKWLTYAVFLTKPGEQAALPAKVTGGSVVNSPFAGKGIMHFHHVTGADIYKIYESDNPNAAFPAGWWRANPDTFDSSRGGEVIPKNVNQPTWWKVVAHNTAGDGPPSDAFGATIHND